MNHESEESFLKNYSIEKFERPSVTTDVIAFILLSKKGDNYRKEPEKKLSILMIRRGVHPFKGKWALPGGFLRKGETVEHCAIREITEETGIKPTSIKLVGVYSESGRDPRGWIISNAFMSVLMEENSSPQGGDDADEAIWFEIHFEQNDNDIFLKLQHEDIILSAHLHEEKSDDGYSVFNIIDSSDIAFDHASIITKAMKELRCGAENFSLLFDFLPEKFTLGQMQQVQEAILEISVLQPNFRRKAAEYVVETDEYTSGAGHRPAKLYRKK